MKRAVLALPFGVALFACHKDPAPPVAAVVDAAPPPVAVTTVPEVDAASVVDAAVGAVDASALSDAVMASAKDLKVLVPKEQGEGGMLSLDGLTRAINRAVTAGRADAGAESRVVVYADTTIDYGCSCPPWVFAPFWNTGRVDGYVYPVLAPGVPDPPLLKQGIFRFAGHFDGRKMTGFDWLKMRHQKADEEGSEEFAKKGPVFVLEGWCFEPAEEYSMPELEEVYAKDLAKMQEGGRLCVGTHLPKHASK